MRACGKAVGCRATGVRRARPCLARASPRAPDIRPIAPLPPPLDALGLVPRCPELSLDAVDGRFGPVLAAVVEAAAVAAAAAAAGAAAAATSSSSSSLSSSPPLVGVYLRGSVPRGLFIPGVSDVDAVALVVGGSSDRANAAAEEALASTLTSDPDAANALAALRPTKVELRVHCVPEREAAMLREAAAARSSIPPSLARRALGQTLAFELSTSAITLPAPRCSSALSFLNLPALLPDVARLPPAPWLLPTVAADVGRAVRAAREEEEEGKTSAAATRWALKRVVRAALELQFLVPSEKPLRWSRDLYHCAALTRAAAESGACPLSARVADAVDEALRLYVAALSAPVQIEAACDHALRLADALDAAFLAAMLSVPAAVVGSSSSFSSAAAAPRGGRRRPSWSWWRQLWPVASGGRKNDDHDDNSVDNLLIGAELPPIHARISGPPRLQFDYPPSDDACRSSLGAALAAALGVSASSDVPPPEPVMLRGFATRWGAVGRWGFAALLTDHPPLRGKARAAPSLAFTYCEPALRDVLVAARGVQAAPSLELDVSAPEFVRAMLRDRDPSARQREASLPPSHPFLYLQAELGDGHPMLEEDGVREGLDDLAALLAAAAGPVRIAQRPRLWASVRGSVSPLHYDNDASVLVQVVGRKRMLLFSPDQLECLRPYPDQHILRRRARVDVTDAAAATAGLQSRLEAVEVVLEPGDAVFFPREWMHYTESLTPSVSLTARFAAG